MKHLSSLFILFLLIYSGFSQSINQKSIIITNNSNTNYVKVEGMPIKFIPPAGFIKSDSFFGYTHPVAGSSIVINEFNVPVNKTFISYGSKQLFRAGVIVESETMYKINGFEAMLVQGTQKAHGKSYKRLLLVVGDNNKSVLLNASFFVSSSPKHELEIKKSLLSVIFMSDDDSNPLERFDFTVNVEETSLKPADMMISGMTFTDDGHMPSKSDYPISFMIRKSKNIAPLNEEERITLSQRLFELYPINYHESKSLEPRKIRIDGLFGYEIFGVGTNKEALRSEMIYQITLFDDDYYYVFTGITGHKFKENAKMFRDVSRSFKRKK